MLFINNFIISGHSSLAAKIKQQQTIATEFPGVAKIGSLLARGTGLMQRKKEDGNKKTEMQSDGKTCTDYDCQTQYRPVDGSAIYSSRVVQFLFG